MVTTLRNLVVLLVAVVFAPMAQAADDPIALSDDTKTLVALLDPISGPPVTPEGLDGKVVVVTFFASWCPPCHTEFTHLNELYEAYHDQGVEIIAINRFEQAGRFEDGGERLAAFIATYEPAFSVVAGNDAVAAAFGNVARIPTVLVFDRDGASALHFIHVRDSGVTNPKPEEVIAAIQSSL
ncbi:MAG: TlpA disulfide reductase family protein [Pseudomonadota bacterium]